MFTCRQMLVFRIEKQYENSEFPGGSNKSVVDEINKLGSGESYEIEAHDFVSIQKNWLDILKCIVFLGWFWITLAIVFLAGSKYPNIYSIGYLVGSFIFLWQGGEFYLRPIYTILRWWKFLVAYNVLVITVKAVLHLPVCIFIDYLEQNWGGICFFIKAFGIRCNWPEMKDPLNLTSGVNDFQIGLNCNTFWQCDISYGFCFLQNSQKTVICHKNRRHGTSSVSCSSYSNYAFSTVITSVI